MARVFILYWDVWHSEDRSSAAGGTPANLPWGWLWSESHGLETQGTRQL